jgi:hypothetical protein
VRFSFYFVLGNLIYADLEKIVMLDFVGRIEEEFWLKAYG